jgi:hypothetical protein
MRGSSFGFALAVAAELAVACAGKLS